MACDVKVKTLDCKLPQQYLGETYEKKMSYFVLKVGEFGGLLREETLAVPTRDDLFPVHLRKTIYRYSM